jgi:hypothetical protein
MVVVVFAKKQFYGGAGRICRGKSRHVKFLGMARKIDIPSSHTFSFLFLETNIAAMILKS